MTRTLQEDLARGAETAYAVLRLWADNESSGAEARATAATLSGLVAMFVPRDGRPKPLAAMVLETVTAALCDYDDAGEILEVLRPYDAVIRLVMDQGYEEFADRLIPLLALGGEGGEPGKEDAL